ncbi:MAG: DUF4825 domain-containing protein [Eubacterium sp.]|nr:DUF4825 domain-containing protein [Eubacterium sp.]
MSKIPCEVIQDLMPLYIDGLTNEVTDRVIVEHVEECDSCRKTLTAMRSGGDKEFVPDENEKKEIDFLKKNKKRNLEIILGSLGATVLIIALVIFVRMYIVGQKLYGDWVVCDVKVDGNHLDIKGTPVEDVHAISRTDFIEENGVITITTTAVLAGPIYKGGFQKEYTAESDITQVRVNDRIVWDSGKDISQLTSSVYETRHDYIGDMPENGRTAQALNIGNNFGEYTNELKTDSEPYGWKLVLTEDISPEDRTLKESDMESYAYIMIAVIDNLDNVTYQYTVNGVSKTKTVDKAMATKFFGKEIKDCGKSARLLDELIDKTGLE